MALSILNNISAMTAENQLSVTQANLQKTLTELSSGQRINSGADDAAGLSIANGLAANVAALTQSASNASNGVGLLQTVDGAYSQVTTLLNRAVTLATEASNGGLTTDQVTAIQNEYTQIMDQIDKIGSTTTFNGTQVFGATASVYISDGTTNGSQTISTNIGALSSTGLGLGTNTFDATDPTQAQTELGLINSAIGTIASDRGTVGAYINELNAASNIINTQNQNLASAENQITAADIGQTVADMTKYNILEQTGMSALSQSNQAQQAVLKLLQ